LKKEAFNQNKTTLADLLFLKWNNCVYQLLTLTATGTQTVHISSGTFRKTMAISLDASYI